VVLAANMREADRAELWHSSRADPEAALRKGLALGRSWAVEWEGRVVALFGCAGTPGETGFPWMLASDDLTAIRKSFLRGCRPVVEGWLQEHPTLTNAVWSGNEVHIQWIKWLGFTFYGSTLRNGETFLHFHRSTHV
jgi:hypothetical protein